MSYPDEWEERVEAMAADLAHRGGDVPESIRLLNKAVMGSLPQLFGGFVIAGRIFNDRALWDWGEAEWTARDLKQRVLFETVESMS